MPDPQTPETTSASADQERTTDSGPGELIRAAAVEAAYILEAVRK